MVRCYVGHVMTSMDMKGIQLSVLRVDDDEHSWWLSLLDAPTTAPGWPYPMIKHSVASGEKLSDDDYRWNGNFEVHFRILNYYSWVH